MRSPLSSTVMQCLTEVAESGSIRKAADRLFMSPSAVNRQILNLEERIGTPLFEREPRGVRLTRSGEIIVAAAREFDRSLSEALAQVDAFQLGGGRVAFGSLTTFADTFVAPMINRLREQHPNLHVSYFAGNSSEIVQKTLEGELDLGLCWNPPNTTPIRRIGSVLVPIGVAVVPAHPLAAFESVRLRDCLEYPVVFPSRGMEFRSVLDRINLGLGRRLAPCIEVNSIPTLKRLACSGPHGVMMTANTVLDEIESGQVVLRPLSDPDCGHLTLTLFQGEGRHKAQSAQDLTTYLAQEMEKLEARMAKLFARPDKEGKQTCPAQDST